MLKTINTLFVAAVILFAASCASSSKVSHCPTPEYKTQKFNPASLTKVQKRLAKEYETTNAIKFDALPEDLTEKISDTKESPEFASLKSNPTHKIQNYKPFNAEIGKTKTSFEDTESKSSSLSIHKKNKVLDFKKETKKATKSNQNSKAKNKAITSLVLGIISLFFAGVILGTLAIIFGAISMKKLEKGEGRGMAVAGLVLGIIGVVGAIVYIATL